MSGQPLPPRLPEAFAKNATACTPEAPVAGGKTAPFPTGSQITTFNGAASLDDGFVPLNMTAPTSGGVPPFGVDMNGILFVISSWAAYLGAGQLPFYDAALQTAMGGYALGAVLAKAAAPNETWTNIVAGNVTDPDTGGAGWVSSTPLSQTFAPTAGTNNNVALANSSDQFLDISTAAGNSTITGFVAPVVRNGQRLTVTKTSADANTCTLASLTGSSAANQLRLPSVGQLLARQYDQVTFQYNSTLALWIQTS